MTDKKNMNISAIAGMLRDATIAQSITSGQIYSSGKTLEKIEEIRRRIKYSKADAQLKQKYLDLLDEQENTCNLEINERETVAGDLIICMDRLKKTLSAVKDLPSDVGADEWNSYVDKIQKERTDLKVAIFRYKQESDLVESRKRAKRGHFGYLNTGSICFSCIESVFVEEKKIDVKTEEDILADKVKDKILGQTEKVVSDEALKELFKYNKYAEIVADPSKSVDQKAKDIAAEIVPLVGQVKEFSSIISSVQADDLLSSMKSYDDWCDSVGGPLKDPGQSPFYIGSIAVGEDVNSNLPYYYLDRLYFEKYGKTWRGTNFFTNNGNSKFKSMSYEEYLNKE